MMVLYATALSTYCAKVRVALRYKSLPFEERTPPDGYGSAAYRHLLAMGTVPALVEGDLALSESEAIVEYLEETHPQPALLPGDAGERARIRALSRVHDCWVEPQLRALYPHVNPRQRDDSAVRRHHEQFHRRLNDLAALVMPRPFLAGESLTLADCAWATTLLQAELMMPALGVALELPGNLASWRRSLSAHPAVRPDLGPCQDAMTRWLASAGAATG